VKGGDLDNAPTLRYFVTAEVVFRKVEQDETKKQGWLRTMFSKRVVWVPDLGVLSWLWRWSSAQGVRLELVFAGEMVQDAVVLWKMLEEGAANPFADMQLFEDADAVAALIPYRPDLLGVIDLPDRSARYGGRGMTMEMLP
jgi:hypothetical protein